MSTNFYLTAQYDIVKYEFSDSYETDNTYQKLDAERMECIKEITILRDSIIHTKAIPEEDKLFALQLINMLYDDPGEVINIMTRNGDAFPWFQLGAGEDVEDLVHRFSSRHWHCELIKNTYHDINSNIILDHLNETPEYLEDILDILKLDKNKERSSVFLRNIFSTTGIDKCLRNKDIYFSIFSHSDFNKFVWSQQFYSNKKHKKRKNNYFALHYNPSSNTLGESFDYIIEYIPIHSLYYHSTELNMLKPGGRIFVELDYMSEEEYQEYKDYILTRHQEDPEKHPSDFVPPYFTKESLDQFVLEENLHIEYEKKDGDNYRYVFVKKTIP